MPDGQMFKTIKSAVISKYGSLEEPDFGFVRTEVQTTEHRQIISILAENGVDVVEYTDVNDDVSINFSLNNCLGLSLSLIGPFAFLKRIKDGDESLITSIEDCKMDLERLVISIATEKGVSFLDRDNLLTPLPLAIPNRPVTETKVYHALFADDDEDAYL